jgi:hypothetical protein
MRMNEVITLIGSPVGFHFPRAMSSNGKRNRRREPYLASKSTPSQPGDEQCGNWTQEMLAKMDARFVAYWSARFIVNWSDGRAR